MPGRSGSFGTYEQTAGLSSNPFAMVFLYWRVDATAMGYDVDMMWTQGVLLLGVLLTYL